MLVILSNIANWLPDFVANVVSSRQGNFTHLLYIQQVTVCLEKLYGSFSLAFSFHSTHDESAVRSGLKSKGITIKFA